MNFSNAKPCAAMICLALLTDLSVLAADRRLLSGGTFTEGDAYGDANETLCRVTVAPFRMDAIEGTNRDFAQLVAATGDVTDVKNPAKVMSGPINGGR